MSPAPSLCLNMFKMQAFWNIFVYLKICKVNKGEGAG